MFFHILQRNSLTALVCLILGLLLQGPLAMVFIGAFYALVAFLAPLTIGRPFALGDWALILAEAATLVLFVSLTSAFSAELNGVAPSLRDWWRYSKSSWKTLSVTLPSTWRASLRRWLATLTAGLVLSALLLLSVAWFEAYGF
jgi:hypothetical protein